MRENSTIDILTRFYANYNIVKENLFEKLNLNIILIYKKRYFTNSINRANQIHQKIIIKSKKISF